MAEQSVTGELLRVILPAEVGGKKLVSEAEAQGAPVSSQEKLSQEQIAALTQTYKQKDQASLQGVKVQLKSEIDAEERKREEAQAWQMYARNFRERIGKAPPDRTTEYGKGLFANYVEQTYKPYRAALEKAVEAAGAYNTVKRTGSQQEMVAGWQKWVKASDEMDRIENSRAYQEQQTYEFNKRRAAQERDRYGDYVSTIFSKRSEKAALPAYRIAQAPARSGEARATVAATSSISRFSPESASSRSSGRSETSGLRGSGSSSGGNSSRR